MWTRLSPATDDRDRYRRLCPLFQPLAFNLVVDSVVEGITPAWVYTNNPAAPHQALMWNRQDALLLAGQPSQQGAEAVALLLHEVIIPDARRRHIPQLALFYTPAGWEVYSRQIFQELKVEQAARRFYQPGPLPDGWQNQLPEGYALQRLNLELLANERWYHGRDMTGWVNSFWPSYEAFTESGFGYYLLQGDTVASWCLTVYASANEYELGVATVPEHRGKGLAPVVAAACVAHCYAQGGRPHWHCWEDNLASIVVAEKVGFQNPTTYTVYRFPI